MKKSTIILVLLVQITLMFAQDTYNVLSPDENIKVELMLNAAGEPIYSVKYIDSTILLMSRLGLILADNDFTIGLKAKQVFPVENVTDKYTLFSEKKSNCLYHANKLKISFTNTKGSAIAIVFQVSNDGVAFRYELEGKNVEIKQVKEEITTFHFPLWARAWLHPHTDAHTGWNFDQPSYEENYMQDIPIVTKAPFKAGWSFPALFKSGGSWVLVTEADVDRNYCGSRLSAESPDGEYAITFPQELERTDSLAAVLPESVLPWNSPWRVILIGKTLAPIVESTLVTDVSAPCRIADTSFIKPGKSSWSWVIYKDDSTIYSTQKRFIDYASQMNWQYCLIDAYWDKNIGYEKIKELIDYGKKKNVGIILWYNSAGSWNTTPLTPRDLMFDSKIRQKEFEKISKMGVVGVKVDFWGGDGQSMIAYYHDLIEDAAKYKLLVNCHGATVTRGWTRTYPNLVSMEAVKGFEFVTFEQSNADLQPNHCCILPFTRNVVGPMDFTPVCFSEVPNIKRITTNGFELALSVIFQSGIQHYAEVPEGMAKQPDYVINFMKNVPSCWDDIKFIDGYPGKFTVVARKGNGKWYIAGINGEVLEHEVDIDLSLLGNLNGGKLITDGGDKRTFEYQKITGTKFKIHLKPLGGFVFVAE
jgi:alpha-glucosidase